MLIEASKGGHANVVQLLLDYPHSVMLNQQQQVATTAATNLAMLPGQVGSVRQAAGSSNMPMASGGSFFQPPSGNLLHHFAIL